jgi:hypothetical protein
MYSSTDFGTLCFIPLILCCGMRFFLAVIRLASSFSGDPFHTASVWVAQLGRGVANPAEWLYPDGGLSVAQGRYLVLSVATSAWPATTLLDLTKLIAARGPRRKLLHPRS